MQYRGNISKNDYVLQIKKESKINMFSSCRVQTGLTADFGFVWAFA